MPCYQYKGRKYTAIELLKFIKQDEQRFLSDNNLNVGKWRYEVPDSELKVTFDEAMEMLNNGKGEMLLSDMIDDKELFDSYPKLKDTKIYLYGKGLFDNTGGTADASQNYISIGLSGSNNQPYLRGVRPESMAVFAYDNTSLQSVLSHEVQHLIQFNEGFNGGGTVEGVLDHLTEDTLRGFQETGELAHLDPETKKAVARSRTIQKYGDKNTAYRSLSGEVESRNVQTRMNMTPEERLNTLLSETEDVSREDQIVLMDGFGVSNLEGDHQQLANDIDETFNYQNEIVITDKDGAADMFKGVLPADVVNNIRNGNWEGGFTVRGKIIIHSGLKHPGSILSVLVHEKSHIQIRRVIPRESDRIKYFSDVFTRIAPNELKRVIGTDYSEDPEHVQAEEYYVHLTEELAFKGELPESVDDQTKKHIFDILNGFTTLKNIQDVINTKIRNGSNGGRIQSDTRGKGNVAQRNTSKNKMDTGTSEALPESGGVFRKGSVDRSIPLTDVLAQAKQNVQAKKSDVSLGEKPNDMTSFKGKQTDETPNKVKELESLLGTTFYLNKPTGSLYGNYNGKQIRLSDHPSKFNEKTSGKTLDLNYNIYSVTDMYNRINDINPFRNLKEGDEVTHRTLGKMKFLSHNPEKEYVEVKNSDGIIKKYFDDMFTFESQPENTILFKRTKPVIDILADAKAGNKLDKDTKTILNAADRNNAKPIEKRTLTQKLQAFRDITQEKDAPVWRWISALKKQGATIKDEDNPFLLMKLAPGRMQTLFEEFEKEYINPLIEIGARIEKAIGKNNFIEPYLIALHAPERNASTRADKLEEWRNKDFNLENWIATENAQRVKLNAKELTEDEIKEKIDEQHELGNYKTEKEVEAKRKELDQMDFSGILPMNKDEKGNVVDEQFENDPDALARSIVNGFEGIVPAELVEELKAARKKLTDKVLQNEVEANKLTRKQADEYKAKWENYIPLRGWKDAAEKHFVYNQTNNGAGSIIKHAGGRGSMAESPLGYIYKMGYQSTNDKVQGEIKEALLRMAMANLDNDLESMFEVKQAYFKKTGEVDIDGQEVWTATTDKPTKQELENGTVVAKRYTGHMKNRAFYQSVEHEVLVENPNGGTIVFVFDKTNPDLLEVAQSFNHMNMMMRIAGGKANSAETLNNIIQFRIPWINMSVRDLTNLNKAMLTQFNLQFIATNTPRDFTESNFDSYIVNGKPISLKTNKQAVKAIDQYLRGVDDTTGLRDMLLSFYEMGGTTGHTRTRTPEEYQKDIFEKISKLKKNGLKKGSKQIVSEWLTRWNQRVEDGVRFSVFMNEIRNGKTPQMAAFRSRNATVDFNIRGKLSPVLGFMWGFFEVSANALAKTGDYMAGKGSTIGISVRDPKIQRRALKSAAFMMMLGFVDALLNDMLLGGDDDDENDYYNRSRWMRHNYLNIPIPNSKLYVPIPLPPGWRAFKGFGAVMYDYLLGQRGKLDLDDAAWQSVQNFIDGYSPVPITQVYNSEKEEWQLWTLYTPMLLKPISEVAHNQNYMGLQITKEPFTKAQEELLANHSLSKENTGIAARYFADLMWKMGGGETQYNFKFDEKGERVKISPAYDWNPSKISHIIGGYGGGTFTFVGNIMTTAQRLIDPNEEIDLKHVPFVTAILKKTGDSKWNTIREYYSLQDDIKGMSELSGEYMKRIISKEKGAVKNYVNIQGSQYLQNYKAILENNDNIIKDLSEQVNYQTGEGEEKVIEQMKSTIKSIDELKKKYNKK